jgi:hypothetical protein
LRPFYNRPRLDRCSAVFSYLNKRDRATDAARFENAVFVGNPAHGRTRLWRMTPPVCRTLFPSC